MHTLTSPASAAYRLRVDIQHLSDCQWYWAEYDKFVVDSSANGYRLTLGAYTGTAGDGLRFDIYTDLNGVMFTTYDVENDVSGLTNCAVQPINYYTCPGGFWSRNCLAVLINHPADCGFYWLDQINKLNRVKLRYTRMVMVN